MDDFLRCLQDGSRSECRFDYNNIKIISPEAMIRNYVYDFAEHPGILECQSKSVVGISGIQETVVCTYTKDPHYEKCRRSEDHS